MTTDLLELYGRASEWTLGKVAGATSQLNAVTPCDDWVVHELLSHMLDTQKYFVAATVHYLPVGEFIPVTPTRAYDSRSDAGPLAKGATRTLSLAGVVPAGARAVACNITVTGTVGPFGYLTVVPGGGSVAGPSTINWDREGATIANGFQVGLDASRQITVGCDGVAGVSTQFIVDVTGYYS